MKHIKLFNLFESNSNTEFAVLKKEFPNIKKAIKQHFENVKVYCHLEEPVTDEDQAYIDVSISLEGEGEPTGKVTIYYDLKTQEFFATENKHNDMLDSDGKTLVDKDLNKIIKFTIDYIDNVEWD